MRVYQYPGRNDADGKPEGFISEEFKSTGRNLASAIDSAAEILYLGILNSLLKN